MAWVLMMAQSKGNANTGTDEVKRTIFHDFLGKGCASDSSPGTKTAADTRRSEESPSASVSVGASSGGGRGPISTTSDLGSERQVGNQFEGVPFYGPRSDFSGPETSNRFAGSKRSNLESGFMGSLRDGFPQKGPESSEGLHLMKMLRNAGGEQSKQSHEEEMLFSMHAMRPTSASLILQPPSGSRTDANVSRWERAIPINVSPTVQCPPRAGQVSPFGYQLPLNRSKEANVSASVISQAAADEGSRTGIKGSRILSSINASGRFSERISDRNPFGSKQKSVTNITEPESSIPPSRRGLTSASRQMTIFYGGQAHVFDDVHPNKADVIMALAGSNGGSWSTNYLPKSAVRPSSGESSVPNGENETGVSSNSVLPREFRGRLPATGCSSHGLGVGDLISVAPGGNQGVVSGNDTRTSAQAAEPASEEK